MRMILYFCFCSLTAVLDNDTRGGLGLPYYDSEKENSEQTTLLYTLDSCTVYAFLTRRSWGFLRCDWELRAEEFGLLCSALGCRNV